jgi:preprotein translocase SecE subunit
MAEPAKKKRLLKKTETVRERSSKPVKEVKPRRLHAAKTQVARPLSHVARVGRKEYYLPMPDNKFGRFLNKRRSIIPRFIKESVSELRQVTWPTRSMTIHLTIAVFLFAFFFGLVVAATDYGLDKLFKQLIIK